MFIIDCPGVVPPTAESETEIVLKGVVRAERLESPELYAPEILSRVKREYIVRTYGIHSWTDANHFLSQLAMKTGRLGKGGEPDLHVVGRNLINDWQRGRLPYFYPPSDEQMKAGVTPTVASAESTAASAAAAPADGKKRKREDPAAAKAATTAANAIITPQQEFSGLQVHALLKHAKPEGEEEGGEPAEQESDDSDSAAEEEAAGDLDEFDVSD